MEKTSKHKKTNAQSNKPHTNAHMQTSGQEADVLFQVKLAVVYWDWNLCALQGLLACIFASGVCTAFESMG